MKAMPAGPSRPSTTCARVAYALVAGPAVGAVVVSLVFGMIAGSNATLSGLKDTAAITMAAAMIAFIFWLTGVIVLGGPAWAVLHSRGRRDATTAAATGAILPVLAVVCVTFAGDMFSNSMTASSADGVDRIVNGRHTFMGWLAVFAQALMLGAVGSLVGATIWRVAYMPIRPRRHLLGWAATFALVPAACALLAFKPTDPSCHNVMRDGQRSVPAKVSFVLDIQGVARSELRNFLVQFGRSERLDVRDRSSVSADIDSLNLSLCTEAGPTITAYDLRFVGSGVPDADPAVHVMVFQPRGGTWRSEAQRLQAALERRFPGKVSPQDQIEVAGPTPGAISRATAR